MVVGSEAISPHAASYGTSNFGAMFRRASRPWSEVGSARGLTESRRALRLRPVASAVSQPPMTGTIPDFRHCRAVISRALPFGWSQRPDPRTGLAASLSVPYGRGLRGRLPTRRGNGHG